MAEDFEFERELREAVGCYMIGGDEKMQLVQHMVPLFDLESRGINDELYFDAASLNPDLLREVFRGVFDVMHQRPHYDMMMNE